MSHASSTGTFEPTFANKYLAVVGNAIVGEGDDLDGLRKQVAADKGYVIKTERYQAQAESAQVFGALSDAVIPQNVVVGAPAMAAAQAIKEWDGLSTVRERNMAAFDAVRSIVSVEQSRPGTITNEQGVVWHKAISAGIALLWPDFNRAKLSLDASGFSVERQALCVIQAAAMGVSPHILNTNVKSMRDLASQI